MGEFPFFVTFVKLPCARSLDFTAARSASPLPLSVTAAQDPLPCVDDADLWNLLSAKLVQFAGVPWSELCSLELRSPVETGVHFAILGLASDHPDMTLQAFWLPGSMNSTQRQLLQQQSQQNT